MIKLIFTLLITQVIWGQTNNTISGIVAENELALENAEVINLSNKNISKTNGNGIFYITAKLGDTIVFYKQEYESHKLIVKHSDLPPSIVKVNLEKKAIELEEVVINKTQNMMSKKQIQAILDKKYVDDFITSPKNRLIYDGTIENGMDITRIIAKAVQLFKSKNKTKKQPKVLFKTFVFKHLDNHFFKEVLNLTEYQIADFIAFCETAPQVNAIIEKDNVFDLIDFLMIEKELFLNRYSDYE